MEDMYVRVAGVFMFQNSGEGYLAHYIITYSGMHARSIPETGRKLVTFICRKLSCIEVLDRKNKPYIKIAICSSLSNVAPMAAHLADQVKANTFFG